MNDRSDYYWLWLIKERNQFVTIDDGVPARSGDLVGVELPDGQAVIQKFKGQKNLGVVRELDDYFDQPAWRDVTWKRVEASAELLPQMPKAPKPKKARAKSAYWPRRLAV